MDPLQQKIKDLEFLLRREKIENKTRIKEILYQVLEIHDALKKMIEIALKQPWPQEARTFVDERFSLILKRILQTLQRYGARQINSLGQIANLEYHEIIQETYQENTSESQIIQVEEEGFVYEGEVIRMAKVVVSKNP